MSDPNLVPQPHGGALSRNGSPGRQNYRKGKMYRRAMLQALDADPKALAEITKRAVEDAKKGDAKARDHIHKVIDDILEASGAQTNVTVYVLTAQMIQQFSADEFDAFGRCLPAFERLGVARTLRPGSDQEGEPEEA